MAVKQATKITPVGDNLLVLPAEQPKETPGGIVLPDSHNKGGIQKGTVVALADIEYPFEKVEKGMMILYKPHMGYVVPGDQEMLILPSEAVLGIIEE